LELGQLIGVQGRSYVFVFRQTKENAPRTMPRIPMIKSENPRKYARGGIVGSQPSDDSGKWKNRHGATLKIVRRPPRQIQMIATAK
jgi:hypothetical protein